jgi:hypothetical protein
LREAITAHIVFWDEVLNALVYARSIEKPRLAAAR